MYLFCPASFAVEKTGVKGKQETKRQNYDSIFYMKRHELIMFERDQG